MSDVKLQVEIKDATLCPRYQAVVLESHGEHATKYLSEQDVVLAKSGMRPISPIVDVTNYLMLLTGQPLHAFDYDKLVKVGGLDTAKIVVRAARTGEKLELLDGKTIELAEGDIVITSNDAPVALAGAMGGANTEIDADTKRIVVESATFNLYNLRGTQFRHGIFSEAITRFTKGQPPALTDFVIRKFVAITEKHYGLKVISPIVDAYPKPVKPVVVKITTEQINDTLGSNFGFDEIITTLENVGFKAKLESGVIASNAKQSSSLSGSRRSARDDTGKNTRDDGVGVLKITAPWWRTDIHIGEDIIEEVGRLNGYDNITAQLPPRVFGAPTPDKLGDLKSKIRQILSSAGANEVLTYSFVSEKLLTRAGQDPKNSYKIINSISPELQYVRQQLTPSLLEKVYENQKAGYDQFALFEMNQVFPKSEGLTDEKVPFECPNLALVLFDSSQEDTNYYAVRAIVEKLMAGLDVEMRIKPRTKPFAYEQYFEPKRACDIFVGDKFVGNIAGIKTSVLKRFKLPRSTAGFEIAVDFLLDALEKNDVKKTYKQSQYQTVKRDITFRVSSELEYVKLANLICKTLSEQKLWFEYVPVSIWQKEVDSPIKSANDREKLSANDRDRSSANDSAPKTKNISFNLTFASYEKTLSGAEIAGIMEAVAKTASEKLGAEIV